MQLAKVIGDVVITRKDENLAGVTLLVLQPIAADGSATGRTLVAVDSVGAGVGAKMLAAVAAAEWTYSGGTSEQCATLALAALAGGELIEADDGFSSVIAIWTLVLADRAEALEALERSLEQAHRSGSLLAKSHLSWARAYAMHRFGELDEAEAAARAAIEELSANGVVFEKFPGLPQDDLGIMTFEGGAQVAWFKDPDGNILSLDQM